MFLMMRAVGEMLYQDPEQHTFINFITRHLGKGWGYFSVWSYWLSVVFIGMAEITAISHYVQFWFPSWPSWMIEIGSFDHFGFGQSDCSEALWGSGVLVCYG